MANDVVATIRDGLGAKAAKIEIRSPRRVYVDVGDGDIVEAARYLFDELQARYVIATGMETEEGFEVLHHFSFDADGVVVSLRVKTGAENPEVPSLASLIKGASFIEREMHDLLGINFPGHPNLERLILPDDWPEGVYPLRRGAPWEGKVEMPS